MLKILTSKYIIILIVFTSINLYSQEEINIERPKEIIELFKSGQVVEIYQQFDSAMSELLSPPRLAPIWKQMTANYGEFNGFGKQDTLTKDGNLIVNTDLKFEKAIMNIMIAFDLESEKISGLFLSLEKKISTIEKIDKPLPSYIDTTKFYEEDIIIKDKFDLNGKLSIPNKFTSEYVFILVPGSGPSDMDGTIGENTFLKNLAWGLASDGFAVLRYDKLTYKFGKKLVAKYPNMTQNDEYNNSINSAIELVSNSQKTQDCKIILAGHSQGASVITSFSNSKKVDGLILLSGTPRKLYNLYVEQLKYIYNLDEVLSPSERTIIKQNEDKIDYYNTNKTRHIATDSLPLDLNYEYLKYLDKFDPIDNLSKSEIPVFIINGEYDYQVTVEDFNIWKSKLQHKDNIEFKLLNTSHIFAEKDSMSVPADYKIYTPIAPNLFELINKWINNL